MPRRAAAYLMLSVLVTCFGAARAEAAPCAVVAELDDVVNAGTAGYLEDALAAADAQGCQALVVLVDTPGGTLDATRTIVQSFLTAPLPVITYVHPAGARAGSAGMFITLAGHVAAMTPGSNIGAAHPVMGTGQDPEEGGREQLAKKIVNDTAAFARAIAEKRRRNVEWAEAAVRDSLSQTATEAEQSGVIDLLAPSPRALLDSVHGRSVELDGRRVTLDTRGAELRPHAMSIQQRVLAVLGNPNVTYVLLMIGLLGIMMELYNPGIIVGGVVGGLCLLLAAVGLNALPVHWGGIVLLLVAVGLFVAELFVTSYGLLAAAGVGALLLGSALLFDRSDPDFFADASVRLSWGVVAPLAGVVGIAAGGLAWRAAQLRKRAPQVGREALVGAPGVALSAIDAGGGSVRVHGERWHATSDQPIEAGAAVRVVRSEGLTVAVERERQP